MFTVSNVFLFNAIKRRRKIKKQDRKKRKIKVEEKNNRKKSMSNLDGNIKFYPLNLMTRESLHALESLFLF